MVYVREKLILLFVVFFVLYNDFALCKNEEVKVKLKKIIITQFNMYPKMEITDLFKIVYQAAMGNKHLLKDESKAYKYLKYEFENIEASDSEPLYEDISPDGRFVRVNLRPYKAKGWYIDDLFEIMLKTANYYDESVKKLDGYCDYLLEFQKQGCIPFSKNSLKNIILKMKENQYKPFHHSKEYKKNYNPAYRVVSFDLFRKKFLEKK